MSFGLMILKNCLSYWKIFFEHFFLLDKFEDCIKKTFER